MPPSSTPSAQNASRKRRCTKESSQASVPEPQTKRRNSDYDQSKCQIVLLIDWGTWTWTGGYVIQYDGKPVDENPNILLINGQAREVRMIATWVKDKFLHGLDLENEANKNPELADKIMELFKLKLYEAEETSATSNTIDGILRDLPGNKTYDMLISEHLRAVVHDCKAAILESDERAIFTEEDLGIMLERMSVRITVPEIWGPGACRRMQTAATRAGLNLVVLASEAQSATAYLIHRMLRKNSNIKLGRKLRPGTKFTVADLGCGTGDTASYTLNEDLSTKCRLDPLKHNTGALCGSGQVDQILWELVKDREGAKINKSGVEWVKYTAKRLGITERDFERKCRNSVEKMKREFRLTAMESNSIRLYGTNALKKVDVELSTTEIRKALEKVTNRVIKMIAQHIGDDKIAFIMVTGGFSRSDYLMAQLKKYFQDDEGIMVVTPNDSMESFPVVTGGLLRYENITKQTLPTQYGYGLLQRQEFDEKIHTDSFTTEYDLDGEPHIKYNACVQHSPYDPEIWVIDDCLKTIIPIGAHLSTDGGDAINMEYRVPRSDPRITDDFVYMTKDFPDNIRTKVTNRSKASNEDRFRSGIYPWTSVDIPLEAEDLGNARFSVVSAEDGVKCWVLHARVAVKWDGRAMEIWYEILKPSNEVDYKEGKVAFRVKAELFDSNHSEFLERAGE